MDATIVGEICILCLISLGYGEYSGNSQSNQQQLVANQANSSRQRFMPIELQSHHPQLGSSPQQLASNRQSLQSNQSSLSSHTEPGKGKVFHDFMDVYEKIPVPHLKYDKDETPVLSYGSDGLNFKHGDRKALYGECSYFVQIRYYDILLCGAALIKSPVTGKQVVISAAHCLVRAFNTELSDPKRYTLRMGVIGRDEQGQSRNVKKILVHSGYTLHSPTRRPSFHDIGLLIPDQEFELNEYVSTVKLPQSPIPYRGDMVTVAGYGKGREAGHDSFPTFMRTVQIPVWDLTKCDQTYLNESGNHIITEAHFCAGGHRGGLDTCQGKLKKFKLKFK